MLWAVRVYLILIKKILSVLFSSRMFVLSPSVFGFNSFDFLTKIFWAIFTKFLLCFSNPKNYPWALPGFFISS